MVDVSAPVPTASGGEASWPCRRCHVVTGRVPLWQMRKTLTIRLGEEHEAWLARTSKETGLPRGQIVRNQIEKAAKTQPSARPFMRLAGVVVGARDLSRRQGFSRS